MEVSSYLEVVRRWWLLLLGCVVVAAAGGLLMVSQLPRSYEAEVRILVGPINTDLNTQRAAGQLAQTYAQLVTSQRVTEEVIRKLNVDMRPSQLQNSMTAVPNDVTRLVVIRVQSRDPDLAARLANAAAEELALLGATTARAEGQTQIIDPAEPPDSPSAPQGSVLIMLAALAGLIVAIAAVVLIEYFRDSVHSQDEVRALTGARIFGAVPAPAGRRPSAATLLDSELANGYRALAARLDSSLLAGQARTLLVTGVELDGTAAVVASGIALAFADRGVPTALVDADVHRPEATQIFGLRPVPDLERMRSAGQVPFWRLSFLADTDASLPHREVDLTVVPSGVGRELVRPHYLTQIMEQVSGAAEVVVIVAPPLDRSAEALMWAGLVDAVVLAIAVSGARRRNITSNVEALRLSGLKLAGTIVVESPAPAAIPFRRARRPSKPRYQAGPPRVAREMMSPRPGPGGPSRPGPETASASGDPDS